METENGCRSSAGQNNLADQLSNVTFENNEEFGRILNNFCANNAQSFNFPDLSTEDKRRISDLFVRKLQSSQPPPNLHKLCLSALRLLSRDTNGLREFETADMFAALRYHARLQLRPESKALIHYPTESQACDNVFEAQKVIFNLIYNSDSFRSMCGGGDFVECLFIRMSLYKTELSRMSPMVKFFDAKTLFLLFVRNDGARKRARDELRGIETLVGVLAQLIQPEGAMFAGTQTINENDCDLSCEILKSLYTLTMDWDGKDCEDDAVVKEAFLKITPTLIDLIKSRCIVKEKTYELKSQMVNLFVNYPVTLYPSLAPFHDSSDVSSEPEKNGCTGGAVARTVKCKGPSFIGNRGNAVYQDHDMTVVNEILDFLNNRLDLFPASGVSNKQNTPKPVSGLKETLTPVLCLLQNMAKYNRYIRRYLKVSILPPLEAKATRNFTQLPEEGRLLRNKLVRLMTSPISEIKELVAELVFVICKESVARMIKYTGYGNAAGLLARKGLMGGPKANQNVDPDYSEDSEDSDTEEYKAIKDDINPVTGRVEKNKPNPMDEMTEEQKEYEALELAKLLGRIANNGVIQPAVIDESGRPVRVEHFMQLREMADANNNSEQSDTDDD